MNILGACAVGIAACVPLFAGGCAEFKQVQFFEVAGEPDPLTGMTPKSYYRMTIKGRGDMVEQYRMRAAYLSATTIDTLDGKIPTIPEADLDEKQQAAYEQIREAYYDAAKAIAMNAASGTTTGSQGDNALITVARQAWAVSLNNPDFISLGQIGSSDPFRFRKLVFYAAARTLDLEQYNAQVGSVIDKTSALGRLFRRQGKSLNSLRLDEAQKASREAIVASAEAHAKADEAAAATKESNAASEAAQQADDEVLRTGEMLKAARTQVETAAAHQKQLEGALLRLQEVEEAPTEDVKIAIANAAHQVTTATTAADDALKIHDEAKSNAQLKRQAANVAAEKAAVAARTSQEAADKATAAMQTAKNAVDRIEGNEEPASASSPRSPQDSPVPSLAPSTSSVSNP